MLYDWEVQNFPPCPRPVTDTTTKADCQSSKDPMGRERPRVSSPASLPHRPRAPRPGRGAEISQLGRRHPAAPLWAVRASSTAEPSARSRHPEGQDCARSRREPCLPARRPPQSASTTASRGRSSLPRPTWPHGRPLLPATWAAPPGTGLPAPARSPGGPPARPPPRPSAALPQRAALPSPPSLAPARPQLRPPPRRNGGGPSPADGRCAWQGRPRARRESGSTACGGARGRVRKAVPCRP